MQRSVLTRRRHRTWSLALALATGAGILAGCSSPPKAADTTTTSSTQAPPTSARTTTSSTVPTPTTAPGGSKQAVAAAWLAEANAFYTAGELDQPNYPPLLQAWVKGGPVAIHAEGFLQAEVALGIVGPSTWRIGNVRVLSVQGSRARVEGCSYDPGSHYKASGEVAPSDLGGGAGFTAYDTVMELISGHWLVDATATSSPTSSSDAGPCHGF